MHDTTLLMRAVSEYASALHHTDVALLDDVFHPSASLFDVDAGDVRVDPYPQWRADVDARPSPAGAGHEPSWEVTSVVMLSADVATVGLRITVLDEVFVDHLVLVRDGGRFRVVAKAWHLEATLEQSTPGPAQAATSLRAAAPSTAVNVG